MKVCEICAGIGHNGHKLLCPVCEGTGLICLGYESEARYAALKADARARGEREGWTEMVMEQLTEAEQREQYPRLARLVTRRVEAADTLVRRQR